MTSVTCSVCGLSLVGLPDKDKRIAELADALRAEQEKNAKLLELLREIASSGIEYDDPRCDYLLTQIDRETLDAIRAAAKEG